MDVNAFLQLFKANKSLYYTEVLRKRLDTPFNKKKDGIGFREGKKLVMYQEDRKKNWKWVWKILAMR